MYEIRKKVILIIANCLSALEIKELIGENSTYHIEISDNSADIVQISTRRDVSILLVSFNAFPIEGSIIYRIFRLLNQTAPVVALVDPSKLLTAEIQIAQETGFSACLLSPYSKEKWIKLCEHLKQVGEFVVI